MTHDTAILDIGSGKMTVLVGERGVNGTILVKGMGVSDYAGFADGQWLDEENTTAAIGKAVSDAQANAGITITKLYVGIPGEFTSVVCKEAGVVFGKRRRIKDDDLFALMDAGDDFDEDMYEVINIQPIYYSLDNDRHMLQPVGTASSKLGGALSYVLCEAQTTAYIRSVLRGLGIRSVEFVSSVLAEALLLFTEEKRDNTAVLIDIGYLTTTVSLVRGDGLLTLSSFSMGGGHITGDLATALGLSFADAENLKRKTVLSISAGDNDIYEITGKDGVKTLSAGLVNEIVMHRIFLMGKAIAKCLKLSDYDYPDYIPYSLTGGGVSFIRGAKDLLSQQLGRNVEIVAPALPQVNRPNLSSGWGLLDMAIKSEEPVKQGFFARLFKK